MYTLVENKMSVTVVLLKSDPMSVLQLKLFPWPLFKSHTMMYLFTRHLVRGTSWCDTKIKTMVQV